MAFRIITDSSCDLTQEMADELGLQIAPLSVNILGQEHRNYLDGRDLNVAEFYKTLRTGEMTSTTAANPTLWKEIAEPILQAGEDVLTLGFSSGLSTTCNAARIAAEELMEEYPDRKMVVVDTLSASLGQGLLCYLVVQKSREGASLEETAEYAQWLVPHLCHWFTVDDLYFLKRGGRVSGATAVVGSLLQVKPVMHMDDEGHLIKVTTARGRKASIHALFKKVEETAIDPEKQVMFISHGDCLEDAEYLANMLKEKLHVPEVHINYVGPVIGSHSGPGTLAMFFVGQQR